MPAVARSVQVGWSSDKLSWPPSIWGDHHFTYTDHLHLTFIQTRSEQDGHHSQTICEYMKSVEKVFSNILQDAYARYADLARAPLGLPAYDSVSVLRYSVWLQKGLLTCLELASCDSPYGGTLLSRRCRRGDLWCKLNNTMFRKGSEHV